MACRELYPHLFLVDLPQKAAWLQDFITSWVYHTDALSFVVDPGPGYSIPTLLAALQQIGVDRLDYILLTHIHIDHAGGLAQLYHHFPGAAIVCHPKGIAHLTNPARLWQGSRKVLGKLADEYGEILAVPEGSVIFTEVIEQNGEQIMVYRTPGHAPHHLCFSFQDYLFAGEVAGVYGEIAGKPFQRPATPPPFKLEISLDSLETVSALDTEIVCWAHYGSSETGNAVFTRAKEQLLLWVHIIEKAMTAGVDDNKTLYKTILEKDPAFQYFQRLSDNIKKRERYFMENSFTGMKKYLQSTLNNYSFEVCYTGFL